MTYLAIDRRCSCCYRFDAPIGRLKCERCEAIPWFDFAARAREKQASRDADAAALASGEKTPEQLRRENSAFAFPRHMVRLTFPKREK